MTGRCSFIADGGGGLADVLAEGAGGRVEGTGGGLDANGAGGGRVGDGAEGLPGGAAEGLPGGAAEGLPGGAAEGLPGGAAEGRTGGAAEGRGRTGAGGGVAEGRAAGAVARGAGPDFVTDGLAAGVGAFAPGADARTGGAGGVPLPVGAAGLPAALELAVPDRTIGGSEIRGPGKAGLTVVPAPGARGGDPGESFPVIATTNEVGLELAVLPK